MSRAARWGCCLALLLAGCGGAEETVREPDLVVEGSRPSATAEPQQRDAGRRGDAIRIAVVTHGQASSPFWVIVRNGIDAAARQLDASVSYRSPDTYSVPRMEALIAEAVATRPDGLVVSIPSAGVAGPIRRAIRAGIPVVSINSGSERSRALGALAHVGQPEYRAGLGAGRRLARAGVRRGLCVNHEVGNAGLAERCRGFARALRRAGGTAKMLPVNVQDRANVRRVLADAIRAARADGVLTLNTDAAEAAVEALGARANKDVRLATFDLSPTVLEHCARRPDRVRRRPAGLPAGLPADHAAGAADPLRPLPGRGRGGRDRPLVRHAGDGAAGAAAEPPRDPLTVRGSRAP